MGTKRRAGHWPGNSRSATLYWLSECRVRQERAEHLARSEGWSYTFLFPNRQCLSCHLRRQSEHGHGRSLVSAGAHTGPSLLKHACANTHVCGACHWTWAKRTFVVARFYLSVFPECLAWRVFGKTKKRALFGIVGRLGCWFRSQLCTLVSIWCEPYNCLAVATDIIATDFMLCWIRHSGAGGSALESSEGKISHLSLSRHFPGSAGPAAGLGPGRLPPAGVWTGLRYGAPGD